MLTLAISGAAVAATGLAACGRSGGLFSDHSIPVAAQASAHGPPRFVGLWAAEPAQCRDAWVFAAHSLHDATVSCDFDRADASPAGYSADALCHAGHGPQPSRLDLILPATGYPVTMTVSGGPFADGVALQRCAARP